MGTLTEWKLLEIEDFTGKTLIPMSDMVKKALGLVWLLVMVLFLLSAYGLYGDEDWWRNLTIVSMVISQILVIIWWPDAKFGTVANILILAGIIYDS
ncbi:MAG: hypothetical protein ACXAC2_04005 [Candidatus Kariarchaeaceae archaeon]